MHGKILWAIVGGFLAGVLARSFVDFSWPSAAFLLFVAATTLSYAYFDISKRRAFFICSIALVACGVGILRMDAARLERDPKLDELLGKEVMIAGMIVDEPDVRESNVRLHIQAGTIIYDSKNSKTNATTYGSATSSVNAGVLVIAPSHTEISYGDVIRATGTLQLPEAFDTGLGRQFNYPMFLAKDGILYTLAFADVEKIEEGNAHFLKAAAIWAKHTYLTGLQAVLPEPESGLAGGITVGDKRGIGKEFSDIFITVGLVHIIVLSGYNITIVMNLVGKLLATTRRIMQLAASALIVVFIVLMAGGSASATRAGAMALLPLVARMTGRLYLAVRALGGVALVMVAWNPYILAFDPGFQLSVLATLGLVLFSPLFAEWFAWIPEKFALREIASSTLGTQTAVLPLLLYQNGLLSIVALPANLLALVAVPWAMGLSVFSALAGTVFGHFGTLIAFPAYLLLAYIIKIGEFFASLPFASVSISAFSVWWMCVVYVILFVGVWLIKINRTES